MQMLKEFYSAVKKNEILKLAGRWIERENSILSKVIQIQKDNMVHSFLFMDPRSISLDVCIYPGVAPEIRKIRTNHGNEEGALERN